MPAEPAQTGTGEGDGRPGLVPQGNALPPTPEPASPAERSKAHYLWAVLIARIYEVFPLLRPLCGGQMRLIAFITEGTPIRRILDHIGVELARRAPDAPIAALSALTTVHFIVDLQRGQEIQGLHGV